MPDSRRIVSLANALGFEQEVLEKVVRLLEVLADVSKHPNLGEALALKGGTAFNLFFDGPPRRLSIDLDFNFVAAADRRAMLEQRPGIEAALERIASARAYAQSVPGPTFLAFFAGVETEA